MPLDLIAGQADPKRRKRSKNRAAFEAVRAGGHGYRMLLFDNEDKPRLLTEEDVPVDEVPVDAGLAPV